MITPKVSPTLITIALFILFGGLYWRITQIVGTEYDKTIWGLLVFVTIFAHLKAITGSGKKIWIYLGLTMLAFLIMMVGIVIYFRYYVAGLYS
ncbi:MAG: hypothetical protein WC045_00430 [Patescibacteria group bacterium]